jgi:hypothetical protein
MMYLLHTYTESFTQFLLLYWSDPPATSKRYVPNPATVKLLEENPASFWNCDLLESPCRYLEPHYFFHQGPGKEFVSKEQYKRLGGTNNNLPAIMALSWWPSSAEQYKNDPANSENHCLLPRNISFVHVHKCGGTTIKTLLVQTKNYFEALAPDMQANFQTLKYSFGGGSVAQKERNQQRRQAHIDAMVQAQAQNNKGGNNNNHQEEALVFATVRDPVERFVSAVQQVMHYHEDFRSECLKRTARATLECAIRYCQTTNYLRDVHLIPMATHFRLWDEHANFRLAIVHLRDIPLLAQYFGSAAIMRTNSGHNNDATTEIERIPHGRDRSQIEYATSPILAHMTVQRDCTPKMLKELCQLYAIDVALMQTLGFETPHC